ncbi:hypothetical protein MHLP_04345 [Candidatus Mycoplasma haematolamae str. Purdue]|uniref:Uncharacterized protein n=1 Tax=Mycoplasma haematolamae (strain Purdue) TaxID=1212765 RepID=I7CKQ8_MYCHA|nr:hypothetical protein [Candidatus Mycoplasma haematolamae]AFO52449.1 hypothetical protein MHLP_04345 [Candidatus Mycoplasma haematolamae str. Purdue]
MISHTGIVAAITTLVASITTNIAIFSAYQANGGITLDWDNIPEEFKSHEGYTGEDPVKKQQYELYKRWGSSVVWYLYSARCPEVDQLDETRKKQCEQHRKDYYDAPEVKNAKASLKELQDHYTAITKRRET